MVKTTYTRTDVCRYLLFKNGQLRIWLCATLTGAVAGVRGVMLQHTCERLSCSAGRRHAGREGQRLQSRVRLNAMTSQNGTILAHPTNDGTVVFVTA